MLRINELIKKVEIDLKKYPDEKLISKDVPEVVILPDLHGNVLTFIQGLILNNVLQMSPETYADLVKIYEERTLAPQKIEKFKNVLFKPGNIKLNIPKVLVLLGDELSDRGDNDLLTLNAFAILRMLKEHGCQVIILISNHGMEFFKFYMTPVHQRDSFRSELSKKFNRSLRHACATLKLMAEQTSPAKAEAEFKSLVENNYLPFLKALSYVEVEVESEPWVLLLTHAQNGLEILIEFMRFYFGDEKFNPQSTQEILVAIDAVNTKFREGVDSKDPKNSLAAILKKQMELFTKDPKTEYKLGETLIPPRLRDSNGVHSTAYIRLGWNIGEKDSFIIPHNFISVCGHEGSWFFLKNRWCLDSNTGKHLSGRRMISKGPYCCVSGPLKLQKKAEKKADEPAVASLEPLFVAAPSHTSVAKGPPSVGTAKIAPAPQETKDTAELEKFIAHLEAEIQHEAKQAEEKKKEKKSGRGKLFTCGKVAPEPEEENLKGIQLSAAQKMLKLYKREKFDDFFENELQALKNKDTALGSIVDKLIESAAKSGHPIFLPDSGKPMPMKGKASSGKSV